MIAFTIFRNPACYLSVKKTWKSTEKAYTLVNRSLETYHSGEKKGSTSVNGSKDQKCSTLLMENDPEYKMCPHGPNKKKSHIFLTHIKIH